MEPQRQLGDLDGGPGDVDAVQVAVEDGASEVGLGPALRARVQGAAEALDGLPLTQQAAESADQEGARSAGGIDDPHGGDAGLKAGQLVECFGRFARQPAAVRASANQGSSTPATMRSTTHSGV